jgi:hypothetical protein
MGSCEAWEREAPARKEKPTDDDIEEFAQAFFAHKAVCAVCRKQFDEIGEKLGSIGKAPVALVMDLTDEVIKEMNSEQEGLGILVDRSIVHLIALHALAVSERWKIVKFNESMMAVRAEASQRKAQGPGPVAAALEEIEEKRKTEHCNGSHCHYLSERRCICLCAPCGAAKKKDH